MATDFLSELVPSLSLSRNVAEWVLVLSIGKTFHSYLSALKSTVEIGVIFTNLISKLSVSLENR